MTVDEMTIDEIEADEIAELINWFRQIGFREVISRCEVHKVPRKFRREVKLIKKMCRGALRISEGKPIQPIAEKHFKR